MKLLIVEDEVIVRTVLARKLTADGHVVKTVGTAEEVWGTDEEMGTNVIDSSFFIFSMARVTRAFLAGSASFMSRPRVKATCRTVPGPRRPCCSCGGTRRSWAQRRRSAGAG